MSSLVPVLVAALLGPPPSSPAAELTKRVEVLARQLTAAEASERARAENELLALGPQATEPLLRMTKDADPAQLEAIRSILPKYGGPAVERLYWASGREVFGSQARRQAEDEAILAVTRMGNDALPELKRLIDAGHELSQSFGIRVLRQMGPPAFPGLIELLKHADPAVRASVATLLANMADPRTADALLSALQSEDASVCGEAARALGTLGDRRAIEPLLALLRDRRLGVRLNVAWALARMYEPRLLAPLVRVLRSDPNVMVRTDVANALIRSSGDPVARRLARRYKPWSIDPMAEGTIRLASVLRLILTGLVLYVVLWAGVKSSIGPGWRGVPRSVWWSALAVAGMGFVWSRVLVGLSGLDEWLVLLVVVPATACMAWSSSPGLKVLRSPMLGLLLVLVVLLLAPFAGLRWGIVLVWGVAPWLLVVSVVVAVAMEWWLGRRVDRAVLAPMRRAVALGAVGFYLGYGVGWISLWGYLGV